MFEKEMICELVPVLLNGSCFRKRNELRLRFPKVNIIHDPGKIWLENIPGGKNPLECHLDFGWQFNFLDPVISLVSWFAPLNLAAAWRHLKGLVATPLGPDITYSGSCFLGTFQINLVHAYRPEPLSSCKLTVSSNKYVYYVYYVVFKCISKLEFEFIFDYVCISQLFMCLSFIDVHIGIYIYTYTGL